MIYDAQSSDQEILIDEEEFEQEALITDRSNSQSFHDCEV
jgi:hypothetical protein